MGSNPTPSATISLHFLVAVGKYARATRLDEKVPAILTDASNGRRVESMGKTLFLILAASALVLMQVGACMSAPLVEQADMQCCHSMPCAPGHSTQSSCKKMVSARAPNMTFAKQVSLHDPAVATVEYPTTAEFLGQNLERHSSVTAQQHSPPDLYTLHSSLLI